MRISLRLILLLFIGITAVSLIFAQIQVRTQKRGMKSDLERRAEVLADSLQETLEPLLGGASSKDLQRIVDRLGNREGLTGIAVYDAESQPLALSSGVAGRMIQAPATVSLAMTKNKGCGEFTKVGPVYADIYSLPLHREDTVVGALTLFLDADYILAQSANTWREAFLRVLVQTLLISLITLLLVRWTVVAPISKTAQWLRELRTRGGPMPPSLPEEDLFKPLMKEATHLVRSLSDARAAAEEEARLRDASESLWTAERLRIHVRNQLQDRPVLVVSNREPYMHVHQGKSLEVMVPASGLVTALEPILRACDGTWIAHGSGDGDRDAVNAHDRLRVPPDDPQYTLRRVWLSKEEEEGYYYGFANEGLWPLCHIAHTRPTFRSSDWEHYQSANEKFARAVLDEMRGTQEPALLIQDYHFALLPRLVKRERPDARVAIFWHIPWPNAEAFGICPWQRELLDGLLGADLIGFHIQAHCTNFLETVDQALESRIEWEHFAVRRSGHLTFVKPFPISVALTEPATKSIDPFVPNRFALIKELGVQARYLGVGVDRIDYTKGILERFHGIERFLVKYPAYQGQFTFVQIGAPSRTHIKRYHNLQAEVEAEAERINWRLRNNHWKPIVFLNRHHSHEEIDPYYRAADLCLITSLHDGMNLVAKEFVAARNDEQGALILSIFTGASRELSDAVMVNPYDTEQLADAIRFALEMEPDEKRKRMQRMRRVVRQQNVYRWAGNLITGLSEIQIESTQAQAAS
jgi:trehalose-6-phosphate synthase